MDASVNAFHYWLVFSVIYFQTQKSINLLFCGSLGHFISKLL